jgi:ferredoxin-NADP reductase
VAVNQIVRDGAWRVVELLTTPLVPADYLDAIAPLRNRNALRGRIESIRPETADSATLVLRPGRGWPRHRPGQFLRIGVDIEGVRRWRSYSVTSAPDRPDGRIAITVTAVAGGVVSTYLVRHCVPGVLVHLEAPAGEFVLGEPAPAKTLFVTAGSGITPVMGMLRSHRDTLTDVVVVHSAPTADAVVFRDELRALATGRIRLVERHTRTAGRIKPAELNELVPDLFDRRTWACGPNDMLDELATHWTDAGAADRLHTERFRPVLTTTGEGGEVTFARSGVVVATDGAASLLETGEEAGVLMPSGCRMGICYGCVLPLREGVVRDLRDGRLTAAEPGDSISVQTCISAAAGRCRLDV